MVFFSSADFISKLMFYKSGLPSECWKGLAPDQAGCFVGPDLDLNCF